MKSKYIRRSGSPSRTVRQLAALVLCAFVALPLCVHADVAADVDKLIGRMPVNTAAEKEAIIAGLLKLGEAGVRELCGRIKGQDEPLDGKVCAALFGLEHGACRKGNEKMRRIVAKVFCETLQSDATIAAKSYLLMELRTLGREESVKAVGGLLTVKDLCEPAAQTLVSIGTDQAAAALRAAVPEVMGSQRVTIISSLGRMRDGKAVKLLLDDADHNNSGVRHAALFALAEIGDPAACDVLSKAAASNDSGPCEKADHRLLRFAVNLAKGGHKKEAIAICRTLLEKAGPARSGIRSGASHELKKLLDGKAPALQSIFNGKDFDGWVVPENNIWWTVHDGMISCKSGPKKRGNALWTKKKYKNFVLKLDFRYGEGIVDTGIYLRTTRHQVQLGISGSLKRDMTGSMYISGKGYPQEAEGVKELLKPRDWNTMKVQAVGSVYTIWLNGKRVSVYKAQKVVDQGPIGLQLHGGKVMAADFRNIELAEL